MPLFNRMFTVLFLRFYLFIFRGRKREKHQCMVASCMPPTGDLACSPDMCPDWESNPQPLGSQAGTQSTEPHQPGQNVHCSVCLILSSLGSGYTSTIGLLPTFGILSMFLVRVLLMEQIQKYTISVCLLLMMVVLGTWSSDCQVSPLYGCCSFCLQLINKIL